MARLLQLLQADHHHLSSFRSLLSFSNTALALLLLATAAVSSVIFSLCTTNKHLKRTSGKNSNVLPPSDHDGSSNSPSSPIRHFGDHRRLVSALSGIGSKALVVARMVSWKRGGGGEGDEEIVNDEEEAVWRKSILMGEKCRPLNFSGQILYDAEGNEVKPKLPKHHDQMHASSVVLLGEDNN